MNIQGIALALVLAFIGEFSARLGAQSLTGSVVADDTGSPLMGVTVLAVKKLASLNQQPSIYLATVDETGRYSISVPPGQYRICVHGAGLYLDPCSWGAPIAATVASTIATAVPIRLSKGAWFILRIHDPPGDLPTAASLPAVGIAAGVSVAGVGQFPLPVLYENDRVRDYGAVVPLNAPITLSVGSAAVLLADMNGVPTSPQGIPVQIAPSDLTPPSWVTPEVAHMFPWPTAKVIHMQVTAKK